VTIRLYFDEDTVRHGLVAALRRRGVEVVTPLDAGTPNGLAAGDGMPVSSWHANDRHDECPEEFCKVGHAAVGGAMPEVITYQQMKEQYPDQWLLVSCVETDEDMNVVRGEVLAHSTSRDEIYAKLLKLTGKHVAIEYTGDIPEDPAVMFGAGGEGIARSGAGDSCSSGPRRALTKARSFSAC